MKFYLLFILCACGYFIWRSIPDQSVRLIFCDVGQGDATLITVGYQQLLVDGGPNDAVLTCLANHVPFWDRTIEFMVVTHPDADHITGLTSVLQNYQVDNILTTSLTKETAGFAAFQQALEEERAEGSKIMGPQIGQQIQLSETAFGRVLSPQERLESSGAISIATPETMLSDAEGWKTVKTISLNEYNNWSIVLFLDLDGVKVMLTGDLELPGETALIGAGLTQDVDIIKIGHHGSKSSSGPGFLAAVEPEVGVISVGENNRYKHPADLVVKRLVESGIAIRRTDTEGTIEFVIADGQYRQATSRDW